MLLPAVAFLPQVPMPECSPWLRYSSSLSPGSVGTYVGLSFASCSFDRRCEVEQTTRSQGAGLSAPFSLAAYLQSETRNACHLSWRSRTYGGVVLCGIDNATHAPLPWMIFCDQMNGNACVNKSCARAERALSHALRIFIFDDCFIVFMYI